MSAVLIGIAGAGRKSGCTHTALLTCNFLRAKGYTVAFVEENQTNVFAEICAAENLLAGNTNSFFLRGIDYYMRQTPDPVPKLMEKYDFIVLDYGDYLACDKTKYLMTNVKLLTCGSKPWEFGPINKIFDETPEEILVTLNYCFIFSGENKIKQNEIITAMEGLDHIFFLPYSEDPFMSNNFPDLSLILKGRIVEETTYEEETANKKRRFGFNKPKEKENKEVIKQQVVSVSSLQKPADIGKQSFDKTDKSIIDEKIRKDVESFINEKLTSSPNLEESDDLIKDFDSGIKDKKTDCLKDESETHFIKRQKNNGFLQSISKSNPFQKKEKTESSSKENIQLIEEADSIIRNNIFHIKGNAFELFHSVNNLKNSITENNEYYDLANKYLEKLSLNTFCLCLRSGCVRTVSNIDGKQIITINTKNENYTRSEDELRPILQEDYSIVIK